MERSASLDIEALKMTQEQYILASQPSALQRPGCPAPYPVGIYGWRKRCLYFFILLLLVTMIVNLALTIWILKVMNFTVDGMGNLRITREGVRLEGVSEFLLPLYVKEIQSRQDSPLILQSDRNVTVNARNDLGQLTGQLTVGSEMVEAQCQRFEVRSSDGDRVLFSADENEISIGTDRLSVTGNEGVVFAHSVETPHIRAEPFQDLKLESPTRTLTLEAPKGVEVNAGVGEFRASCRKELTLESSEGEILLNAKSIRMPNLPHGSVDPLLSPGTSYPKHTVYEVCVCPSGKLYLSPADSASTCQTTNSVCLWS
ncbi:zeta-sarcoglycan isoform 1-T1 [Clarias gariepinus]|uniref:zeta-sarcoglycan isoform X1 n=1 Tax=Clarias gariepinus TaxID=13013 RepID=UPI00234CEDBE|nr:zeta-sarcoglycan isoform X1 [Clarias gariepinus]